MTPDSRTGAGLRPLVGDGLAGAVRRRPRPAVPEPRRGRLDQRPPGGRGAGARSSCPGTRACIAAPATSRSDRPPPTRRARAAALRFAGRPPGGDDVAIICRNTTEAINHLAYRLRLAADDVVVTTVVEHHANLLPWARLCRRRYVECGADGTFTVDDVTAALDAGPGPALLAITGASNVTGWLPPIDEIIAAAHERDVPGARRRRPARRPPAAARGRRLRRPGAATRCTPRSAPACSSAPGPRSPTATRSSPAAAPSTSSTSTRSSGPTHPTARRPARPTSSAPSPSTPPSTSSTASAGTPSPPTTTDLAPAAARRPGRHRRRPRPRPRSATGDASRWSPSPSTACPTRSSPPGSAPSTASASATAASAPTPTSLRLLGLVADEIAALPGRRPPRRPPRDPRRGPGQRRDLHHRSTTSTASLAAVADIAGGRPAPVAYHQDPATGDFWPRRQRTGWPSADRALGASCARG